MQVDGEITPDVYDPLTNELLSNVNVKPPGLGRINYRNQSMNLFSMIIDYNQKIHEYNSKSELESIYRLMKESVKHNKVESDSISKNKTRTEILEKKLNYEIYNNVPTEGFNDPRLRRIVSSVSQTSVLLAFTALNQTANALTPRVIAIERYFKQNKHRPG
jgi:exoribonuclease II